LSIQDPSVFPLVLNAAGIAICDSKQVDDGVCVVVVVVVVNADAL